MQVLSFDSREAMQDFIRMANEQAHHKLHVAQLNITYGDTWVRFIDVTTGLMEFGQVITEDEMRNPTHLDEVLNRAEKQEAVEAIDSALHKGYVYGTAFDPRRPQGEWELTHKSHIWPIEREVFDEAAAVKFQTQHLDVPAKINLQAAYRAMRHHVRRTW